MALRLAGALLLWLSRCHSLAMRSWGEDAVPDDLAEFQDVRETAEKLRQGLLSSAPPSAASSTPTTTLSELNGTASSDMILWQHSQSFDGLPLHRVTPNDCSRTSCDNAVAACMEHTGCMKHECYCIKPPPDVVRGDRFCWEARCPSAFQCIYENCSLAVEAGRRRTGCDYIECKRSRFGDGKFCFQALCGNGPEMGPERPLHGDEAKVRNQEATLGSGSFTFFKPNNVMLVKAKPKQTTSTDYPQGGSYYNFPADVPAGYNLTEDYPPNDWAGWPKLGEYVNQATKSKNSLSQYVEPKGILNHHYWDNQANKTAIAETTNFWGPNASFVHALNTSWLDGVHKGSIPDVNITNEFEATVSAAGGRMQSNLYPMIFDEATGKVVLKPGWGDEHGSHEWSQKVQ